MDYRELLKKYISHIGWQEGIDYLGHNYCSVNDPFSDEEFKELKLLSEEVDKEF